MLSFSNFRNIQKKSEEETQSLIKDNKTESDQDREDSQEIDGFVDIPSSPPEEDEASSQATEDMQEIKSFVDTSLTNDDDGDNKKNQDDLENNWHFPPPDHTEVTFKEDSDEPWNCPNYVELPYDAAKKSASVAMSLLKFLIAAGTAAPTAIYAFLLLSGEKPENISQELWDKMSTAEKVGSLGLGAASEYVNLTLNLNFFQKAYKILTSLSFSNPQDFFKNLISITSGIGGGFSAGALAYEAFSRFTGINIVFAAFNAGIFFISRMYGVNSTLDGLLNRDINQIQSKIIDSFKHLNDEGKQALQMYLNDKIDRLRDDAIQEGREFFLSLQEHEELFGDLGNELLRLSGEHPDWFRDKTTGEYVAEWSGFVFDLAMGSASAFMTADTFSQISARGMSTFLHLLLSVVEKINDNVELDIKLEEVIGDGQIPIGLIGGLPSAVLYGKSVYELRRLLKDAIQFLIENPDPKIILYFVFGTLANAGAAASMYYLGQRTPGPVDHMPDDEITKKAYAIGMALGGLAVNIGPTLAACSEKPSAEPLQEDEYIEVEKIMRMFQNPTTNRISRETKDKIMQASSTLDEDDFVELISSTTAPDNEFSVGASSQHGFFNRKPTGSSSLTLQDDSNELNKMLPPEEEPDWFLPSRSGF